MSRRKRRERSQIQAVADEFGMDGVQRRRFGDHVERCKRLGDCGTKNERGDFTVEELREKAREFLGQ